MLIKVKSLFLILLLPVITLAQQNVNLEEVEPGRFDQGKMWTFENPPVSYFQEAYDFTPTEEWLDDIRKSSLRFASWCSASFISQNGLIMTNHHCARGTVASVMNEGENFDENGFYAQNVNDERKVPDLYVDQMVMVADITEEVKSKAVPPDSALSLVQDEYGKKTDWKDLILETRTFYSGGKYSIYGFKRYTDIRLVLYPELAMGYFGGDPDNFTYPRYNLDFSFFRAYDDSGEPLNPENFFVYNASGAQENEPVFVIGNPGSTGRYLTMAQLYFQKDVSVPAVLSFLRDRVDILMKASDGVEDVYKKDSVVNLAFSLSNADKAYTGRLDGLNDPYLMAKKEKKEQQVRANVTLEDTNPWNEIEDNSIEARNVYSETLLLSPNALRGKMNQLLHQLYSYRLALEQEEDEAIVAHTESMNTILKNFDAELEKVLFAALIQELQDHSKKNEIQQLLGNTNGFDKASEIMDASLLLSDSEKFFKLKAKNIEKESLIPFANVMVPAYQQSVAQMGAIRGENQEFQKQIMNLQFQLSGISSPPDATFSLRLADGVVKGYEYNGTEAPYYTTYFGMYDRHFSRGGEYPWNLPEKWKNPPIELMQAPLNFVCTADIIGGNSGSPVINKKKEVVGLVFDGNIESLPGYFIFDPTLNRTVSVHTGGIAAALKYIYKADRLVKELAIQ